MYLGPVVSTSLKLLGSKMGLRFLIMMIVGLGALYSMHLLAQDFFKFTSGAQAGK